LIQQDDLFRDERMRMPMDSVIAEVRNKHIRKRPLATARSGNWQYASTVVVSFDYPASRRAQKFTRAAVPAIKILDQASLPPRPIYPNRLMFTLIGLACGIFAGILSVGVRRWPIVAACSFATPPPWQSPSQIPDQWASTAALKIDPPTPRSRAGRPRRRRPPAHRRKAGHDSVPG
jgi:hypothetical protein